MKPFVLGAIFARGGSKGIPRKNIRMLGGKPLLAYAIEAGLAVSGIDKLIVSTDDKEIANLARQNGAETPFLRPAELATDDSPEILSWRHAINHFQNQLNQKVDVLVSIPTTSPLRNVGDVEACLQKLLDTDADVVVTVKEAERNPYFNMLKLDDEGYAHIVADPGEAVEHRQKAPEVFDMTTVAYAARASYVLTAASLLEGKVKTVMIPKERALDIDTELDLEMAEFLINRGVKTG